MFSRTSPDGAVSADSRTQRRIRATPLARTIATALGVDLESIARRDRVRKQDVLAAVGFAGQASGFRLQDAGRSSAGDSGVVTSHAPPTVSAQPEGTNIHAGATPYPWQNVGVPQLLTVFEVDLGAVDKYCVTQAEVFRRRRLSLDAFVCIAYVAGDLLRQFPDLNARWSEAGLMQRHRVHVFVAKGVERGLVRDASDLTLRGFARALAAVPEDSTAGDVYFSVERHTASAFLTRPAPLATATRLWVGAERRDVMAYGDGIGMRRQAWLGLVYDARVLDQRRADQFLAALKQRLEDFEPQL
ncbi:hypothetical protein HC891_01730 [Candidatus Gracilibacteria bacterium]|nr:hypothetical protein [Candidatus Gracilibacteria bacterium]